jgi:hypothetical protein
VRGYRMDNLGLEHGNNNDNDDNNNNNNSNKLQMGRHLIVVVTLHITYARTMKFDYSRFSLGG